MRKATREDIERYRRKAHKQLTEGGVDTLDVICQLLTSICYELEYMNDSRDSESEVKVGGTDGSD